MSAGEGEEGSVDCGEVHGVCRLWVLVCERGFRLVLRFTSYTGLWRE
jgi:hypothetical protein